MMKTVIASILVLYVLSTHGNAQGKAVQVKHDRPRSEAVGLQVSEDQHHSRLMQALESWEDRENSAPLTEGARTMIENLFDEAPEPNAVFSSEELIDRLGQALDHANDDRLNRGLEAIDRSAIESAWAWACEVFGWPFCRS